MKAARLCLIAGLIFVAAMSAVSACSQASGTASPGTPPPATTTTPETKGKVVFSRTTDQNGDTTDGAATDGAAATVGPPTVGQINAARPPAQGSIATDGERTALTFTDFDFDVRLLPAESHIAVRALITVRNDSKAQLLHLPLQLSSALNWELIRLNGQQVAFTVALLNSDADHTGQLHEAVIPLPTPLEPGSSVQLDVTYSGTILQSAKRLLAIGTPDDVANHSDWDRIGADFTGLRGFGNVVWYPVASVPVILGDGAKLFDEIGAHKLRLAGAHFRMALTIETSPGLAPNLAPNQAPNLALVNGHPVALIPTPAADSTVASIETARLIDTTLGFELPCLFLATRSRHAATNATIWTRPESEPNSSAWATAATEVTPFLQSWLGLRPRAQLTVLDLPEDGDIPFETGAMLASPVRAATPKLLDEVMAHALTHAWMQSPRAWLNEGVAHFMGTLWIEKQQGREQALASLENVRPALALAEPESPGAGDGQPLVSCISPVYYRTKATYVLWMLRDLVGDASLSAALRGYDPTADRSPDSFEKLLDQTSQRHNLSWLFNDWIYADKGLPDLAIESVFPSAASVPGSYLVAVNVANNGYSTVEAPIQVMSRSGTVTQRILLAARSKNVQRILIQGLPTEVRLNDGTIPETGATVHVRTLDSASSQPQ